MERNLEDLPMLDRTQHRIEAQKASIINQLLLVLALVLLPIAFMTAYSGFVGEFTRFDVIQLLLFVVIWVVVLGGVLQDLYIRALIIIAVLLVATLTEVYRYGITSVSMYMLTIIPIITTVIFGIKKGFYMLGCILSVLSTIAIIWIISQQGFPTALPTLFHSPFEWFSHIANLAVAVSVGIFLTGRINQFSEQTNEDMENINNQLQHSIERLEQVSEIAQLGYATTDTDSQTYVECDDAFAAMHGKTAEEIMRLSIDGDVIGKMIVGSDRKNAQRNRGRFKNGENIDCVYGYKLAADDIRFLRKIIVHQLDAADTGKLAYVICQDVTKSHLLQEKLFKSQRMEAIGKLAGGVSHDFNNLLAVIVGNLELLRDEIANGGNSKESAKAKIDSCINAAINGSNLTKSMLSFARQDQLEPGVFQLNQTILDLTAWIGSTLPANVDVKLSLSEHMPDIEADQSSTESAILNLILNGCYAMADGGQLTIKTWSSDIDNVYAQLHGIRLKKGTYALLEVCDTGSGISTSHLSQIFEPFYTTKPTGTGSGLGLSMVQGFLEKTGGAVQVESSLGNGTTFRLYFPVNQNLQKTLLEQVPLPEKRDVGLQRILVVEDTTEILDVMIFALENRGYQVTAAKSADEALVYYERNPDEFDLLVTDISMPGTLQGTSLAAALREINPQLPVVYISGFTDSDALTNGDSLVKDIRLSKPFRIATLLKAVEEAYHQAHGKISDIH